MEDDDEEAISVTALPDLASCEISSLDLFVESLPGVEGGGVQWFHEEIKGWNFAAERGGAIINAIAKGQTFNLLKICRRKSGNTDDEEAISVAIWTPYFFFSLCTSDKNVVVEEEGGAKNWIVLCRVFCHRRLQQWVRDLRSGLPVYGTRDIKFYRRWSSLIGQRDDLNWRLISSDKFQT